jgi:predicted metalloprotease with PDZ domain
VFGIPYDRGAATTVSLWRSQYNLSVTYVLGTNSVLYGDPLPTVSFTSPYELLFSTNALNGNLLAQGTAAGQDYRFVATGGPTAMTPARVAVAQKQYERILTDIIPLFGTIEQAPITVIFGINTSGGLEGMYAFSIIDSRDLVLDEWFTMILAHETIHFWCGLRTGDYEDPWWKEGTTSYLGYLVAARCSLTTDLFIARFLLDNFSNDPGIQTYALADPAIREKIFTPGDNCSNLVYHKGAQVTMLLDRAVRDASNNSMSIDRIIGDFTREHSGTAFRRQEYINYIRKKSGADISDIVDRYVLKAGAIPETILRENCSALIAMRAFGNHILSLPQKPVRSAGYPLHW